MAGIYFAYLFDDEAFRQAMIPLVPQLEAGNFESLYRLAKETMELHPLLWSILDNLFLGHPFAEEGELPTSRRLLTMVVAQNLQPITEFNVAEGLPFLEAALPMIGWREEDTKLLIHGRSLCELLVPGKYHPGDYKNSPQDLPWCTGYVGWMEKESVTRLMNQMERSREAYRALSRNPNESEQAFNAVKSRLNFPIENLVEGSKWIWEKVMQILTSAHKAQQALAMTVAW